MRILTLAPPPSQQKDPALISLNDIEKGKLLGAGALCQVHKAYWIARDMDVRTLRIRTIPCCGGRNSAYAPARTRWL
jgi:hypothetical protein